MHVSQFKSTSPRRIFVFNKRRKSEASFLPKTNFCDGQCVKLCVPVIPNFFVCELGLVSRQELAFYRESQKIAMESC